MSDTINRMPVFTPTVAEITRIAAISDPVLRNLQITHCYHQLALVLADRVGPEANWCAYATWASKQAGQTIRKEDLARAAELLLRDNDLSQEVEGFVAVVHRYGIRLKPQRLTRLMWEAVNLPESVNRSSDAVARGNLKVFAEIGHEFARFYNTCLPDQQFMQNSIERFLAELRPGTPPEGQDYLRQAFIHYYNALFENDSKARSELLFLANLEIGLHEQNRLQPEIVEALEAPVPTPQTFTRNLLRAYYPQSPALVDLLSIVLQLLGGVIGFDSFTAKFLAGARLQAHFVVTNAMMTIELPQCGRLRLGKDLPANYPPVLQRITNSELNALLAQIDPTPDDVRESGTRYWGDLSDRIHFIADMFRCFHATEALFEPPFTPAQMIAMEEGRLPPGRL